MVGFYLEISYGFWRHTNDVTGKESIYLNIVINNFLENTILIIHVHFFI
jgi:hypothetical protein